MITLATIRETREHIDVLKKKGASVGFVPTMGALHEGHLQLVRRAVKENDVVVASIFVNPIQFNNPEDLAKYPRTLDDDRRMLKEAGCHVLFAPPVEEMYPGPVTEKYDFGPLERVMEGAYRPGHFNGVAVVVKKFFDIVGPDRAYFGEKDYQQLKIIQALVQLRSLPVEIVPCPTVREADGLAMSSRNRRLSPEERRIAPEIFQTMTEAGQRIKSDSVAQVRDFVRERLERHGFVIDYIEIASAADLQPVRETPPRQPVRIFIACFLGKVRLIDNLEIIS